MSTVPMKHIAKVYTDLPTKFGLPRQSGLTELPGKIIFEPPYRDPEAVRGLEGFSHIWLLFDFSLAHREGFHPTVRPPRLGGNQTVGVFASRSPFRPNPIGLSSVRLTGMDLHTPLGPVLYISGADVVSGTPLFDIKPYLPFADSHPTATGGFADPLAGQKLIVQLPEPLAALLPPDKKELLLSLLADDPRPAYQQDPDRIYGFPFAGVEVKFYVKNGTAFVTDIQKQMS